MSLEDDATTFIDEARDAGPELRGMTKKDVQRWLFRIKSKLSERYDFSVEGFETDYEAVLRPRRGDAEFVIDRRGDEVEVNAFVVEDGETKCNEVWQV